MSVKLGERSVEPGKASAKFEERPVKSREQDYYHYSITPKLELLVKYRLY
jgi:hypothetical protein